MSISEFFHMGGYAFYVWTSYGVGFVVFLALVLTTRYQHRKLIRQLRRRYRQQAREQQAK
jgi:heme exporter protein D